MGIYLAKYLTHNISNNDARYSDGFKGPPIGNCISRIQWSCDWWRHLTLKGQGRHPKIFESQYLNRVLEVVTCKIYKKKILQHFYVHGMAAGSQRLQNICANVLFYI